MDRDGEHHEGCAFLVGVNEMVCACGIEETPMKNENKEICGSRDVFRPATKPSAMEFMRSAALSLYLKRVGSGVKKPRRTRFMLSSVHERDGVISVTLRNERGGHQATYYAKCGSRTGLWNFWEGPQARRA